MACPLGHPNIPHSGDDTWPSPPPEIRRYFFDMTGMDMFPAIIRSHKWPKNDRNGRIVLYNPASYLCGQTPACTARSAPARPPVDGRWPPRSRRKCQSCGDPLCALTPAPGRRLQAPSPRATIVSEIALPKAVTERSTCSPAPREAAPRAERTAGAEAGNVAPEPRGRTPHPRISSLSGSARYSEELC
jgi:hypothetical protein